MNIFFLHLNTALCAMFHVDRHVVKMILESAQLLSTALVEYGEKAPYKATHKNHPSAIWARQSRKNWKWLHKLALALCAEYTHRYGKIHKAEPLLKDLNPPKKIPRIPFTPPPQAMPDCYKVEGGTVEAAIEAYRNYYILGKSHLHFWKTRHAWKGREIPEFILEVFPEYKK